MDTHFIRLECRCGNSRSYGIALAAEYDGSCEILQSFVNLSRNSYAVDRLVSQCNRLQLDPIHLPEVIEDFLAELSFET